MISWNTFWSAVCLRQRPAEKELSPKTLVILANSLFLGKLKTSHTLPLWQGRNHSLPPNSEKHQPTCSPSYYQQQLIDAALNNRLLFLLWALKSLNWENSFYPQPVACKLLKSVIWASLSMQNQMLRLSQIIFIPLWLMMAEWWTRGLINLGINGLCVGQQ